MVDLQQPGVQTILSQLVNREVLCSLSSIIYEIQQIVYDLPHRRDSDINEDVIRELSYASGSAEEAAYDKGFRVVETPDLDYVWYDSDMVPQIPFEDLPDGYTLKRVDGELYWASTSDDESEDGPFDSPRDAIVDIWTFQLDLNYSSAFRTQEEAWEDCVNENNIDVSEYDREVYEHWSVTPFFARKLEEQGEKVVDFCGHSVWCRTCTGQAIHMDDCIAAIAAAMEILPGMQYAWSQDD